VGRTRGFDETTVLSAAADTFVRGGYEATSIDDLVTALGVHRGSLYNAFGSKRQLFLQALRHQVETTLVPLAAAGIAPESAAEQLVHGPALDLVLVAAIERGHQDPQIASAVRSALALVEQAVGEQAVGEQAVGGLPSGANDREPRRAVELLGARLYARLRTD
jgi:TetR/AcrR family transcriptional regulator, transcriptional repressor for nem operon